MLKKMVGVDPNYRASRGGPRLYEFPPLPECRLRIVDYMGGDDPFDP
jgi:hypothetical protein